jgi:hypothetical protein
MIRIISLGWNCHPRNVIIKNLLRQNKIGGFLTCPFDLM